MPSRAAASVEFRHVVGSVFILRSSAGSLVAVERTRCIVPLTPHGSSYDRRRARRRLDRLLVWSVGDSQSLFLVPLLPPPPPVPSMPTMTTTAQQQKFQSESASTINARRLPIAVVYSVRLGLITLWQICHNVLTKRNEKELAMNTNRI